MDLSPAWGMPFVAVLATIALGPLLATRFWHRHYPKVAAGYALAFSALFVGLRGGEAGHALLHALLADYVPFIVLLFGLYVVTGGIAVRGDLRPTPWTNAALLAAGTLAASWIGTTGAAMILIRPLLRANHQRKHRAHTVVFFIALVANVGGALTPLGDPPLFLGYLRGVPFFWTLRLVREMALAAGLLLAIYFAIDSWLWRREAPEVRHAHPHGRKRNLALHGWPNLALLAVIVLAVLLSGRAGLGRVAPLGVSLPVAALWRDVAILAAAALSWSLTPRALRLENRFSWAPMREVAWVFLAIFTTIVPALAILAAGERGAAAALVRAVDSPARCFWATGLLSAFLDNAPTYLSFVSIAGARVAPGADPAATIAALLGEHAPWLEAVSAGAVFMGALTYIGNAPNFMVRALAEEDGIAMPSFLGYIARWSLPVMIPVFLIVTLLVR